jgi:hypothetical protein
LDAPRIDPQDVARRLRDYFDAYYNELRVQVEKYSAVADAFPPF